VQPSVLPGRELPWWRQEAPSDPPAPPLEGGVDADVAIVGGGYTGLWTALTLRRREPSLRVVLVEAETCGAGPSGRNGGFLHGYWSQLTRLRASVGDDAALTVARAAEGAVAAVHGLGEDVWLRRAGMLQVSTTPAQDAALDDALDAAHALGVQEEAVPLSADELARHCRSPRFRRGVFFRDGATVQPARLARALRRTALAAGVVLHERSHATDIRPGLVVTSGGRVRAREVVLATNAWMTRRRPMSRRLTNFGSYVVLTEAIPELLERISWTGGEAICDGRMFLHYFRTTEDGRVLMGSGSGPIGFGGRLDERFTSDRASVSRAEAALRRLLPDLAGARVEHAWGGPIDVSADALPFFGTVPEQTGNERIHYGVGYSGNGVGPSWLGGQILASLALGADDEWARLPLVGRWIPPLPPEPFRRIGGGAVRAAILACEEAEDRGGRAPLPARLGRELPRLFGLRIGTR
jgi:glycine/D-amino acid oxidase-like deaminating enzyme